MPRRGESGAGSTVGYDPLPVCAFCIEMLQSTSISGWPEERSWVLKGDLVLSQSPRAGRGS